MKQAELNRNLRRALKSAQALAQPGDAIEIDADMVTVRFFRPEVVKPPFALVHEDAPEFSVVL